MVARLDTAFSKADDAVVAVNRNYANSAGCSIEQIFTPLSISKNGDTPTPGFRSPVNLGNEEGLFGRGSVGPTNYELNPYFPKNVISGDDGTQFFSNCDYNAVVMDPADDISLAKNSFRNEVHTVRTKGLRGPVLISGWGFDLCDTPVPYLIKGEKRTFDPNLVNDRRYWKTGPLAVMWDEERQVWSGGPQIVVGTATQDSSSGSIGGVPPKFTMSLSRAANTKDTLVSYGESVSCSNRDPNLRITKGQWVVAARINYEWIPIQAGGGSGGIFIGEFSGEWSKGSSTSVSQVQPPTEGTGTVSVVNLFADVGSVDAALQSCAYTRIGDNYYLIAAECGESGASSSTASGYYY